MPNLRLHQLRVAAVASLILDSLSIEINKKDIISACLLHDMGNIIKFRLDYFPDFNQPEGMQYWQSVQNDYISKYGKDEHLATVLIAKELSVNTDVVSLIDSVEPSLIEQNRLTTDFGKKISIYADNRVSPHQIVSIAERNREALNRYKDHPHSFNEESRVYFSHHLEEIERQIFALSSLRPLQITDETVETRVELLKSFSVDVLIKNLTC